MHIDFDRVVRDLFAPAAKVIDELILADKPPYPQQQDLEQPDLARGQLDDLPGYLHHPVRLVIAQAAQLDAFGLAGSAAGQRSRRGFEFRQRKRLGEVVVGPASRPRTRSSTPSCAVRISTGRLS